MNTHNVTSNKLLANAATLEQRLDAVGMNSAERERAKRHLRAAVHAADVILAAMAIVRNFLSTPRAHLTRLQTR